MKKQTQLCFSAKEVFTDIRSYLAGRFVGSTRDEYFLEEVVKLLFCKYRFLYEPALFDSDNVTHCYRTCFRAIASRYKDIFDLNAELELDGESIRYIDERLRDLDLGNMQRDVIGDAYELFMGSAVKGQFGQFFTPKNAADLLVAFVNPTANEDVLDLTCGAGGFLASAASHVFANNPSLDMTSYASQHLYGVDKDALLARLARIRVATNYQTTGNIVCADSLVWSNKEISFADKQFDVILTNPPFGSNISAGSEETLKKFTLAKKYRCRGDNYIESDAVNTAIAPQVVFFEQCLNLLKEGGRLGIVIPESMISSRKYGYVTHYLLERTTLKAIVGMPETLFKTSGKGGTHTKTCLVYLEKNQPRTKEQTFFAAEAKWCGHDSRGREIPNDDLPAIHTAWESYNNGTLTDETELGCTADLTGFNGTILAPRSFTCTLGVSIEDKSDDYTFISMGELIDSGVIETATGDEVGKLEYGTGNVPFIRTSDVSNWRVAADSKHKISEKTYKSLRTKQDVRVDDVLMVKDGGYLIGTCAIITELDTKIVYQSHIYKFRVNENDYGITPQYLLAVLSSNYLRSQIEAKTCTLDIINSLGNRHRELIIPIPKDRALLEAISDEVARSVRQSVESRKLAASALGKVELLPVS